MADFNKRKRNRRTIEAHLRSAVNDLAPDVLDRIDLDMPQMTLEEAGQEAGPARGLFAVTAAGRRLRVMTTLAAACLCMVLVAGGFYNYRYHQIDSIIGIDVNPSVELSVNRKNRVLEAKPLNGAAAEIMADMDLAGVDLNVAVNAVIGSMVTHGYLKDLDNAILVTVTNDSISKASSLRQTVVEDIQSTLDQNKIQAVVYDQQVIKEDHINALAEEYGISYGKAYFLKELIDQNPTLTMEDMEHLAPLTMEDIAREITEGSYAVGKNAEIRSESSAQTSTASVSTPAAEPSQTETASQVQTETDTSETGEGEEKLETDTQTPSPEQPSPSPFQPETESAQETEAPTTAEETQPIVTEGKVKVYNTDYENGVVTVTFASKVKWKNPTVSVKDENGEAYSAMIGETDSSSCEIYVGGLEGGKAYTFIIGGISPKNGKQTTVKGVFDTPIFGDGSANEEGGNQGTTSEETIPEETTKEETVSGSGDSGEEEASSGEPEPTSASSGEGDTSEAPSEQESPRTSSESGKEEETSGTEGEQLSSDLAGASVEN